MDKALIKSDDDMLSAPNDPSVDVSYFNQHELMYYERNGYRHIGQEFNPHVTLGRIRPDARRRDKELPEIVNSSCAVLVIMPTVAPVYQIGEARTHAATVHRGRNLPHDF